MHAIDITFAGHTYVVTFTRDRINDVAWKLATLAHDGIIPWPLAFDKIREAKEMIDMKEQREPRRFDVGMTLQRGSETLLVIGYEWGPDNRKLAGTSWVYYCVSRTNQTPVTIPEESIG